MTKSPTVTKDNCHTDTVIWWIPSFIVYWLSWEYCFCSESIFRNSHTCYIFKHISFVTSEIHRLLVCEWINIAMTYFHFSMSHCSQRTTGNRWTLGWCRRPFPILNKKYSRLVGPLTASTWQDNSTSTFLQSQNCMKNHRHCNMTNWVQIPAGSYLLPSNILKRKSRHQNLDLDLYFVTRSSDFCMVKFPQKRKIVGHIRPLLMPNMDTLTNCDAVSKVSKRENVLFVNQNVTKICR